MRFIGRVVGMAVLVGVAVWLGLWWWAESQMRDGFAKWTAQLHEQNGITVSYARMSRGFSPLAASVTLSNMRVVIQPDPNQPPVSLTLPSFGMEIDAARPRVLRYSLPGQISIDTPRADVAVTFGSIALTQQIDLDALADKAIDPFKASDFSASNINLLASGGSLLLLHIDSISSHATINRAAGASGTALNWSEDLKNIALSPLLTRLGSVPFGGSITELAVGLNVSGPLPADWEALARQANAAPAGGMAARGKAVLQAAQGWAAQGGNASASLKLVAGPSTLNASGNVKFDNAAQPSGSVDVSADHLDAFSAAILNAYPQMQGMISKIQAQLSPYLSSSAAGGQTLGMHVVYGGGALSINGEKISDLAPIDWNALENPPAPTPQAPGDGSGAAAP